MSSHLPIPPTLELPIIEPADGTFTCYSNVFNLNWTQTDVRLRFGELIQISTDEKRTWQNQQPVIEERAAVTIPWSQAKVLRDILDAVIQSYEKLNGELKPVELPTAE